MKKRISQLLSVAVLIGLCAVLVPSQEPPSVKEFMRKKLPEAQRLLEGVVMQDRAKIVQGAEEMQRLCKSEIWNVVLSPEYRLRTDSFMATTQTILDNARSGNLDGAAMGFVQMTTQCYDCHQFLRRRQ